MTRRGVIGLPKEVYYSSPLQDEILKYLYRVRGANINQIARALNRLSLNQETTDTQIKNTYALLKKLENYRLVEYFSYKTDIKSRERRLYFLSKKGLIVAQSFPDEPMLFEKYEYKSYSLYTPPKKSIAHHLMSVDAMTDVYILEKNNGKVKIDFINNLIASEKVVKPDFSVKVEDLIYFMEIDRSNERGKSLQLKFERYNKHFQELSKKKEKLPNAIFFIVPSNTYNKEHKVTSHQQLRFKSIATAYINACPTFVNKVDLIFIDQIFFLQTFIKECNSYAKKIIKNYEAEMVKKETGLQKIESDGMILFKKNTEQAKYENLYYAVVGNVVKPWFQLFEGIEKIRRFEKITNDSILNFIDIKKITILYEGQEPILPFKTSGKHPYHDLSNSYFCNVKTGKINRLEIK